MDAPVRKRPALGRPPRPLLPLTARSPRAAPYAHPHAAHPVRALPPGTHGTHGARAGDAADHVVLSGRSLHRRPGRAAKYLIAAAVLVVALHVRTADIALPSQVVFDEVHFGGFVGHYIRGTHFFDLHPPLGKLILYAVAHAHGYDGRFSFARIGTPYNASVPYAAMRTTSAVFGATLAPLAFVTLVDGGVALPYALLGGALVLFDNALHTHSRLILLDAPLLAGVALCVWLVVKVRVSRTRPPSFSVRWWACMAATGLAMALAVGTKLNGVFIALFVGYYAARDVVVVVAESVLDIETEDWVPVGRHFGARFLCLVGLPVAAYVALFAMHFAMFNGPGPGDLFMSAGYRNHLLMRSVEWGPSHAAFGSVVHLRVADADADADANTPAYLHMRDVELPSGIRSAAVALLSVRSRANAWSIETPLLSTGPRDSGGRLLRAGDEFSLRHVVTGAYLSCGGVPSERRVVANGTADDSIAVGAIDVRAGDPQPPSRLRCATWKVLAGSGVFDDAASGNTNAMGAHVDAAENAMGGDVNTRAPDDSIRSYYTHFALVCQCDGCGVRVTHRTLPQWAGGLGELMCAPSPSSSGNAAPPSLWRIEGHLNANMPDERISADDPRGDASKPSFIRLFFGINWAILVANGRLKGSHPYASSAYSWPFLEGGVSYWMGPDNSQIYLLGNPLVWWASTVGIFAAIAAQVAVCCTWLGSLGDDETDGGRPPCPSRPVRVNDACAIFVCGYLFCYAPFFIMERQLFLHHYLPALYCAILASVAIADRATSLAAAALAPRWVHAHSVVSWVVALFTCAAAFVSFAKFRPLSEGTPISLEHLRALQWMRAWNFQYI